MKVSLVFSGHLGSGKSTVSKRIAANLNYGWNGFSTTLKRVAKEQQLEESRTNLQQLGEELVSNRNVEFCTKVLVEAGRTEDGIVIDGLRHPHMLSLLRELMSPARLLSVFVDCRDSVRLRRLAERDGLTAEQVTLLELHSTEVGVSQLRQHADFIVDNSGDVEDSVQSVLRWFAAL